MASSTSRPEEENTKPSYSVKLVLLGEAAVGKSSLILRFVNNEFAENREPTIGAAFLTEMVKLQKRNIKFEIWDTAGQERFASLAPMYYRNAQAALVVYDLTKPSSLVKAKHWVAELQRQATPNMIIALVGNKLDLCTDSSTEGGAAGDSANQTDDATAEEAQAEADATESNPRKISTAEAKAYAEEESLLFFEASAKSNINVQEIFQAIAKTIPEKDLKSKRTANATSGAVADNSSRGETRVNLTQMANKQQENCAC